MQALVKEGNMAAHLDNVCNLHMAVQHLLDDLIPAIVSRLPNLSTLYINSYGSSYRIYQVSPLSGFLSDSCTFFHLLFLESVACSS